MDDPIYYENMLPKASVKVRSAAGVATHYTPLCSVLENIRQISTRLQ